MLRVTQSRTHSVSGFLQPEILDVKSFKYWPILIPTSLTLAGAAGWWYAPAGGIARAQVAQHQAPNAQPPGPENALLIPPYPDSATTPTQSPPDRTATSRFWYPQTLQELGLNPEIGDGQNLPPDPSAYERDPSFDGAPAVRTEVPVANPNGLNLPAVPSLPAPAPVPDYVAPQERELPPQTGPRTEFNGNRGPVTDPGTRRTQVTPGPSWGHSQAMPVPAMPAGPDPVGLPTLSGETLFGHSQPQVPQHVPDFSLPVVHGGNDSPHLDPFRQRAGRYTEHPSIDPLPGRFQNLPADFRPWWSDFLGQPTRQNSHSVPVNLDRLVQGALQFSPQVRALQTNPMIVRTSIVEREADFDWTAFLESQYDDLSDPVETVLVTGDSPRFRQNLWSASGGIRRRNEYGGEFEFAQRTGFLDNNSRFYVSKPQGNARLELSYSQPLLNGSGKAYNESQILLAHIQSNASEDELAGTLQDHLLKVTQAYWELYRARAVNLQKRRLLKSASAILDTLQARSEVDAQRRQILRAEAAVASRYSEIVRAEMAIRNAESQLRVLVNDPALINGGSLEFIPFEEPVTIPVELDMAASIQTALQHRPDIARAIREIRATSVRLELARNEVLPRLDLILNTYVAGLEGEANIPSAWGNQFSVGEPGYTVGFQFEVPLGNRAAKARRERSEWEMQKAMHEFQSIVELGMTEVELAVREVKTSYQEMIRRHQAMKAAETEAGYLHERWRLLAGSERTTTLLMEDLLDAQERQAEEEEDFVTAQVRYALSLAELKRAMGTLLQLRQNIHVVHQPANCGTTFPDRGSESWPTPVNSTVEARRSPGSGP